MIRGACYVRVSTENQIENYSIDEQIDRLKAFCRAKDISIINFYTDGGYSGGNLNRPALQQMLSDIENNLIDTVIVYKLDRLSRSQKDTLTLIEDKFLVNNVDFISVNENFDTSTAFGRAMIGVLSVFAQLEKDQITERFTMGRIGRAKSGYYHGGSIIPTGYDYVGGKLIVNDYEALQVKILYERFASGHSLHDCWQFMKSNYTTKHGAWTSDVLVRNVLKNDLYIGKVKFKGVSYPGVHEPIISQELFDKVNQMFDSSRKDMPDFRRSPFKARTLLASLVYCSKCGARFHGEHGNYSCYSRTKGDKKYIIDPNCKNKKWKIEDLDALVIKYMAELDFSKLEKEEKTEFVPPDYAPRIYEIDKQIKKLIDLYQIDSIPMQILSEKIAALTQEKNTLMENMNPVKYLPTLEDMIESRNKFLELLETGELAEKRACLTNVIDKIIINDDNVNIILKKF
ncbi:MAG: recombinase family protein [Lachnospiraceae bacterium]